MAECGEEEGQVEVNVAGPVRAFRYAKRLYNGLSWGSNATTELLVPAFARGTTI